VPDRETRCVYFETAGPDNTEHTLAAARAYIADTGIKSVLVASGSGRTGARAVEVFQGYNVVVVSRSVGFAGPNKHDLLPEYAERIRAGGGQILTCQHAFGGLARAVRRKLGTYQLDEIVSFVLRNFCEGIKVCCEISAMAADAGLVRAGEETLAIGGTGKGADSAVLLLPANAQDFFDLRVLEIICKPRMSSKPAAWS
jgi:hypothetical protein